MIRHSSDTIVAIATPIGEGGIAVLRVSGPRAIDAVEAVFRGRAPLARAATHSAHVGHIVDPEGKTLDEVVCTIFRNPHSYTGEDVVEISCHGGLFISKRILELLLTQQLRHAEPGEFTKRAFLNGRIDLTQAEAVADLIHAKSERAREASLEQLEGSLSKLLAALKAKLVDTVSLLELELDFVEEGYEFVDKSSVRKNLAEATSTVEVLLRSYKEGRVVREGVSVVLAGRPNVGKSSLLNALLRKERAIVTDQPGTTRDSIEESLIIDGVLFKLTDTAGLRDTIDVVEQEGVRRTKAKLGESDLVLFLIDGTQPVSEEELNVLRGFEQNNKPVLVAANKQDLLESNTANNEHNRIAISAKTGYGLDALKRSMIARTVPQQTIGEKGVLVTNARHQSSLLKALDGLRLAFQGANDELSNEYIAVGIRAALDGIGEITGEVTTDEILNSVFSKFCIGK